MQVFRCRICAEVYIGEQNPRSCPFCAAHQSYFVPAKQWQLIKAAQLSPASRKNLKQALELELDNTNFYKAVSEKSKNSYVRSMFKGLSKVEREHAASICKHLAIAKPDSTVGLDQAVDSDQENIQEAARRENRAVKFYGQAQANKPEIKEFFQALMQIESDHIILTEQELKVKGG
ncbi:MAG: ferritin [Candidatus Omnitrophica bacterium]|nr:ferritin [Candidatus Omnitrophota bacterium]